MKTEWEEVAHFHSGELMARMEWRFLHLARSGILTQFPTFSDQSVPTFLRTVYGH